MSRRVIILLIALVCLAVYWNALDNPFLFDDAAVIEQSERVTGGELSRLFTEEYWEGGHSDKLYRPLVSLSYGINWALSSSPVGFRLVNLALHLIVCLLIFRLTRALYTEDHAVWAAIAAAFFFAVHPIHTEPINSIVGRADLAMTCFSLGAALLWWRDGQAGESTGWGRPLAAALCFAAALLSKESAVTLPGIVLLLDLWRSDKSVGWWSPRLLRCYAPLLAVLAAYLALRYGVLGQLTSGAEVRWFENPIVRAPESLGPEAAPFLVRWATPLAAFARAAGLMFFPAPLLHDSSYPAFLEVAYIDDPRLWYGLGWIVALAAVAWVSCRRQRRALVALGLALIPYSVVSNVFVPIGTVFAERLLYMPSVGVCIALGFLFCGALCRAAERPLLQKLIVGAALGIFLAFSWLTVDRNRDWSSAEALIESVGDGERASYKVLDAFADRELRRGEELREAGQDQGANQAFVKAAEYATRAASAVPDSWGPLSRMGEVMMHTHNPTGAFATFQRAIEMGAGGDVRTVQRAALTASALGHYAEAVTYLERYLELQPRLPDDDAARTHVALAVAYSQPGPQQNATNAVEHGRAALALQPGAAIVHRVLAGSLLLNGEAEEALPHALAAAEAFPERGDVRWVLVQTLVALERNDEAADAARDALASLPAEDRMRPALGALLGGLESPAP